MLLANFSRNAFLFSRVFFFYGCKKSKSALIKMRAKFAEVPESGKLCHGWELDEHEKTVTNEAREELPIGSISTFQ